MLILLQPICTSFHMVAEYFDSYINDFVSNGEKRKKERNVTLTATQESGEFLSKLFQSWEVEDGIDTRVEIHQRSGDFPSDHERFGATMNSNGDDHDHKRYIAQKESCDDHHEGLEHTAMIWSLADPRNLDLNSSKFFQWSEVAVKNDNQEKTQKEGSKTHVLGACGVEPGDGNTARADNGASKVFDYYFVGDDLGVCVFQFDGKVTVYADGCYNKERRTTDNMCSYVTSLEQETVRLEGRHEERHFTSDVQRLNQDPNAKIRESQGTDQDVGRLAKTWSWENRDDKKKVENNSWNGQ